MSPPTVAPDLDRGRTIGKYEILTRLSIGGMAELFLAFIPGPGGFRKFVALKKWSVQKLKTSNNKPSTTAIPR